MQESGMPELIQLVVVLVLTWIPIWRILKKAGLSPWWSLLLPTGIGYLVILGVLAFRPWSDQEVG